MNAFLWITAAYVIGLAIWCIARCRGYDRGYYDGTKDQIKRANATVTELMAASEEA
jgi:hypothetical protein